MEGILREIPGVVDTEVGYAAGAEAVRVVFDPAKLSYETLLDRWYFRMHDPTTKNRQGNDVGEQYRSPSSTRRPPEADRRSLEAPRRRALEEPITTEIAAAGTFERADEFHQDYLEEEPAAATRATTSESEHAMSSRWPSMAR